MPIQFFIELVPDRRRKIVHLVGVVGLVSYVVHRLYLVLHCLRCDPLRRVLRRQEEEERQAGGAIPARSRQLCLVKGPPRIGLNCILYVTENVPKIYKLDFKIFDTFCETR